VEVFIGSLHIGSGKRYEVKNIFSHYRYQNKPQIYDIALLELMTEIRLERNSISFTINGVCLPKENVTNNKIEKAFFSGWGNIDVKGTVATDYLKKAEYQIMPNNKDCKPIRLICSREKVHVFCDVISLLVYIYWIEHKFLSTLGRFWGTTNTI